MKDIPEHTIVREIEKNIVLVRTDDDILPYNLLVKFNQQDDMECSVPNPYMIPSNEKGDSGLEMAKRIKMAILQKIYPDTWEIKNIEPTDRFAKNEDVGESSAGYHYVRYKLPNKSQKLPSFEARVFNPSSSRMLVVGNFTFGTPYTGDTLESSFVKACIAVDAFYGNEEKSFSEYLSHLSREKVEMDGIIGSLNEAKKEAQNAARKSYLRKYLDPKLSIPTKKPATTNMFLKKTEAEYKSLKGFYPYIYVSNKNEKHSLFAVVPEFEDHSACTLATFGIDRETYKQIWVKLARLVDGHFKRQIRSDDYYNNICPEFESLVSKKK